MIGLYYIYDAWVLFISFSSLLLLFIDNLGGRLMIAAKVGLIDLSIHMDLPH
jgi:hypothetical protein